MFARLAGQLLLEQLYMIVDSLQCKMPVKRKLCEKNEVELTSLSIGQCYKLAVKEDMR